MKILYKSNDGKIFTVSDNCTDLIDLPKGIYDDIRYNYRFSSRRG